MTTATVPSLGVTLCPKPLALDGTHYDTLGVSKDTSIEEPQQQKNKDVQAPG